MHGKLQTEFFKFHEAVMLFDFEHNQDLRDKRDMLVKELQKWLKDNEKPTVTPINQGSYAMGTGNEPVPIGDRDYDIDVGLKFNLDTDDFEDPTKVKGWVETALSKQHNRDVVMKTSCVRVQYYKNGKLDYHVDFAVYGYDGDKLQLAKGRKGSKAEDKYWEDADPEELKKLIQDKFSDDEKRAQFKRVIRYMKRWKDLKFSATGNAAPTGIALTIMAYNWFSPKTTDWKGDKKIDDFTALNDFLIKVCHCWNDYGLGVKLLVKPHNNLFEKMKESEKHVDKYKEKIKALKDAVYEAYNEVDPHEAAKILQEYFGDDFPVPDKKETGKQGNVRGIIPSTESA